MGNPVSHFEIMGKDSARLQKFYRDVFEWILTPPVAEMGNYSLLQDFEPGIGGGIGEDETRVSIYIEVDDPQAYLDRAVDAGGTMLMPVTEIMPTTTIAMFRDPAGNTMGIVKAAPRPSKARKKTTARKTAGARKSTSARKSTGVRKKTTARKTATRRARRRR